MQCCCYSEVQKAERQETISMKQDSVAHGPREINGCSLDSRSRHVSVCKSGLGEYLKSHGE